MPFDFPASPSNGQQFTPAGGPTYVFNSPIWKVKGGGGGSAAATYIGDTPPVGPVPGQLWFESDSGATFIWYDDGNTSQWVAISAVGPVASIVEPPNDGKVYGRLNGVAGASWTPAVEEVAWVAGMPLVRVWQGDASGNGYGEWQDGNTLFLPQAGGSILGPLTISNDFPYLALDRPSNAGAPAIIYGSVAQAPRWSMEMGTGETEGGGNTGNNFRLVRHDDVGVEIGPVMTISRQTGRIALGAGQLQFPTTANPSTDARTLDDYREGAWVPNLAFGGATTGITYTQQKGRYTRVGNRVDWWVWVILTSKGAAAGNAQILGLPYIAATTVDYYSGGVGYIVGTGITAPSMGVFGGSAVANFYQLAGTLTNSNFTNTSSFMASGTYEAA